MTANAEAKKIRSTNDVYIYIAVGGSGRQRLAFNEVPLNFMCNIISCFCGFHGAATWRNILLTAPANYGFNKSAPFWVSFFSFRNLLRTIDDLT